ncbi:MAG: hypothetical protein WCJ56_05750, partial [bacterium]
LVALSVYFGFFSFFSGDMSVTIICLILPLIGIVLQPWMLIIILVCIYRINTNGSQSSNFEWLSYFWMSPIIVTSITTWLYLLWEKKGKMPGWLLRFWVMPWPRKMKICAIIFVLIAGIGYCRWVDFPALYKKPPPLLEKSMALSEIKDNRSYCVNNFMGQDWVWQARATPQQIEGLCKQYNLTLDNRQYVTVFWQIESGNHLPYWWHPATTSTTKLYAGGPNDKIGIVVLWDSQSQVMFSSVKTISSWMIFSMPTTYHLKEAT